MTDFALKAANEQAMRAAYAQIGAIDADDNLIESGEHWCAMDVGPVDGQTGYWCILRWNSDQPLPNRPDEVQIVWKTGDITPYPKNIPMFA